MYVNCLIRDLSLIIGFYYFSFFIMLFYFLDWILGFYSFRNSFGSYDFFFMRLGELYLVLGFG